MATGDNGGFTLSPLAEGDLEEIWSYTVTTWSWHQAEDYHAGLLHAFRQLALGRVHGREVDVRPGYLKYPVGSHLVFYRRKPDGIAIIRILHRRMDVDRHLPPTM